MASCCGDIGRDAADVETSRDVHPVTQGPRGSVILVRGGRSFVGTDQSVIPGDGEGPERQVTLQDFALETEAVSVRRFKDFVISAGYVTDAERLGDAAVFAGLVSNRTSPALDGVNWWMRMPGATWRAPEGPGSSVADRLDDPVTQVSWNDAVAFAGWVGGRLPTEAEWEHAARGGNRRRKFPWGDDEPTDEQILCNIWQGRFPDHNTLADGYYGTAPVRSFEPTETGFYNLAGNVWEWTADPFKVRSLSREAKARNALARQYGHKVLKGGSFLCHKSYCYRYRIAARMGISADSAAGNSGFRIAYDIVTGDGQSRKRL